MRRRIRLDTEGAAMLATLCRLLAQYRAADKLPKLDRQLRMELLCELIAECPLDRPDGYEWATQAVRRLELSAARGEALDDVVHPGVLERELPLADVDASRPGDGRPGQRVTVQYPDYAFDFRRDPARDRVSGCLTHRRVASPSRFRRKAFGSSS